MDNNNYKYAKKPYFCSSYDALGAYLLKRINLNSPLWLRWRLDHTLLHQEKFQSKFNNEIYGHYLIVRNIKKEIICIDIRTTVGHISFY